MAGAATRKQLPERLREKLREQNDARQQVYNPYAPLEEPPEEYDAERRMMDEILRGAGRAPGAAPAPDLGGDLVGQMAGRLRALEANVLKLRDEAAARDLEVRKLRRENAELRKDDQSTVTSFDECEGLRKEVSGMKAFLADYGLVWVGGPAPAPSGVDAALLLKGLQELNAKVGDRKIVKNGARAKFEAPPLLRVTVFADGLLVGNGPARRFEDADAFVKDVRDGYFPREFKTQHPDGIRLDVRDRTHEPMERTFAGAGHASGRKARTLSDIGATDVRVGVDAFLQKLPERTIVNGQPVDVREAVKARLAPPAPVIERGDAFATLQVRAADGARFVLRFDRGATVADLRAAIDAEVGWTEYEIRTAFPRRSYRDAAATLEGEGLAPTAVVVLQRAGGAR